NINTGIEKDELLTLCQNRLDNIRVTAFDYPTLINANKAHDIGDAIFKLAPLKRRREFGLVLRSGNAPHWE
ncbi:hypothetical protein, partial [Halomonas sp.]|uniref:hypothetical protein n=1 Tax=Halomonas sp. TaxID=1486246 RepID=UPI0025BAFA7E